ncbi:MAG: sigma-70 family RNA polymerase sigma factor [Deltaproteobacteria bacterium]|nr:sigma-70 family RNA polymerase sigma factor [Deltaproteobacteria bacterium]MBN2672719.1 sigma-70 family RNA polymerase sigma factor [Deltaproteobacteria bacterium]
MKTVAERTKTIESLHRRYAGVIFDLCVRILKDSAEAEDAVQETFFSAFRALDSFTYGDSHLPWLYRIGTNVCLKMIRTKKRKGAQLSDNIEATAAAEPENLTGRLSIRAQLQSLMEKLDERNVQILTYHYVAGMNQQEVADMLGISRRAVVKRLTKLKEIAVQHALEDHHD